MKLSTSLTAGLAATLAAGVLAATLVPAYAADSVDLSHPGTLERGDDLRIPHLEGDVIVDDGALMATIGILSDGLGPDEVQLRDGEGDLLETYTATWFNRVHWEDTDTLLLEANGRKKGATVRCDGTDCERASTLTSATP